jgi:tetratricopeptide (TPR) repeat protein
MKSVKLVSLLWTLFLLPTLALADAGETVAELQHDWAIANYELDGDKQLEAFEALIEKSTRAVADNPKSADVLIWNGIIQSSYAGTRGGLGALSAAKEARKSLEEAMRLNPDALDGSAYTSLGALYYKVPGWPVGFGSDKKAVQLLQKALEINPDGIDSNYFYADYLLEQKEYEEAERYLLKAQSAPPRPDRPLADSGRQQEIVAALAVAREKLHRTGS